MPHDIVEAGNYFEGVLWLVVAAGVAVALIRPTFRDLKAVAAVNFAAFGISDFVEAQTGAWWRPWWLFTWKALCVLAMLGLLGDYLRRRQAT